jgi:hypothetical protein
LFLRGFPAQPTASLESAKQLRPESHRMDNGHPLNPGP